MILIFPTDTVYGLGCRIEDIKSIKKIYELKQRDKSKPLAVLCSNLEQVKSLVKNFDENLSYLKYWPGALTIIFEKNPKVNNILTANKSTIAIRIPNNKTTLALINKYGPLATTSLNFSGDKEIVTYNDAVKFNKDIKVIKGEEPNIKLSSTIITKKGIILRKGSIII